MATSETKVDMGQHMIVVEGNISAGKSTLCKSLSERLGYELYLEPTVENPFLEKYYGDPKRWALPMQIWLLKQRFVTYTSAILYLIENPSCKGVILDRSIFSDIVFAERNFLDGNFSRKGYDYYLELRGRMLREVPHPHAVVYLDASAEVCYDRIHKLRQRDCEGGIPLSYLQGLQVCNKNFVALMEKSASSVISVEWNTFGSVDVVVDAITALGPMPWKSLGVPLDKLLPLLRSPKKIEDIMTMSYTIAEAEGSEVKTIDAKAVTKAEGAEMEVEKARAEKVFETEPLGLDDIESPRTHKRGAPKGNSPDRKFPRHDESAPSPLSVATKTM